MKKYKKFRKQLVNEKLKRNLKLNFYKTSSFLSESIIPPYPIETWPEIDYTIYPPRLIFNNTCKVIITIEENLRILTELKCYPQKEELNLILEWIKENRKILRKYWNMKIDSYKLVKKIKPFN